MCHSPPLGSILHQLCNGVCYLPLPPFPPPLQSLNKLIEKEINPFVEEWEAAQFFPAHKVGCYQWHSCQWHSHRWRSHRWRSHRWRSHRWRSHQWRSHQWRSHQWRSHQWRSHQWRSHQWHSVAISGIA